MNVAALHDLRTFYLFIYNMFQWIGYLYAFALLGYRYFHHGHGGYLSLSSLYNILC